MNIVKRIKNFAHEQLTSLLLFVLVFIALSVVSFFFFAGEKERSLLFVEFKAEETAFALLDHYRQGMTPDTDEFERITGFAVYNSNGSIAVSAGRAPHMMDIPAVIDEESSFTVDWRADTVSITKPLGMFPSFMAPQGGPSRMRSMPRQPVSAAIFVEIAVPDLLSPYRWYTVAQVLSPLLLAAGCASIGFVLLRNWEYRREIDSQRHLVHLGEAARTLSHEIKNPLSAIQIHAVILRKTLPEESLESVRIIEEEVQRLRVLTERVGEFLRNPKGNPELFDAGDFVGDLMGKMPWQVDFSLKGHSPATVCVDRDRFRSVVENLVKNAAESASDTPSISVSVAVVKNSVLIAVEDGGDGISTEDRERAFDPFFTTKERGTGIGLSISRRFVEVAGGSISLERIETGGTIAVITLPRSLA